MSDSWTLVTGASGFLGCRLVGALLARGERVKAFVRPGSNLSALSPLAGPRLQLAFGDITVGHTVYRALVGCDHVYHAATNHQFRSSRAADILDPAVHGTAAVLDAARRRGVKRVVVTSSALALGTNQQPVAMDERHVFSLSDPEMYVEAKRAALQVALEANSRELPVVAVLPSVIIGPGDRRPTPTGHALLSLILLGARVPVLPGGINLVDVDDVVQGQLAAMDRGRPGTSYILGGEDLSYDQLLACLADVTGVPHSHLQLGRRFGVLAAVAHELATRFQHGSPLLTRRMARHLSGRHFWVTSALAQRELGYRFRPARESLARAVHSFLENGQIPPHLTGRLRLLPTG
jgi:dihydroflavonol-4-reductase